MFTNLNPFRAREKRSRSLSTILKHETSCTAAELIWIISRALSTELALLQYKSLSDLNDFDLFDKAALDRLSKSSLVKYVETNYTYANNYI